MTDDSRTNAHESTEGVPASATQPAYVIARTATRNPTINGRTLYLTKIGMWSLDRRYAREFLTKPEAEKIRGAEKELRLETTP